MRIEDMERLIRVAETGSMTHAARQLHLTPAAVSAAVQRVEEAIGVRLFERTTRALHPTDEGLAIIDSCREVVALWQRTLDDVAGDGGDLRGSIHVSAPADTTYQLLESVVATLCARHPQLRIIVDTSDSVHHVHRDAIDMAIRYGPLRDSTLLARKLAESPDVLVAAPAYIAEFGRPADPAALTDHRCLTLQLSGMPVVSWQLSGRGNAHEVELDSPLCGDGYLTRRLAVAGMGIALKSLFDVIDDLEQGRLVRVLPEYDGGRSAIHAVFPSRRFQTARVRALHEAVVAEFATRASRCAAWLVAAKA